MFVGLRVWFREAAVYVSAVRPFVEGARTRPVVEKDGPVYVTMVGTVVVYKLEDGVFVAGETVCLDEKRHLVEKDLVGPFAGLP